MVRIEKVREVLGFVDGITEAVLDLQVSTVEDLPSLGDTVKQYKVEGGSIAQIIQTGQIATLDDDGSWYADGEEIG